MDNDISTLPFNPPPSYQIWPLPHYVQHKTQANFLTPTIPFPSHMDWPPKLWYHYPQLLAPLPPYYPSKKVQDRLRATKKNLMHWNKHTFDNLQNQIHRVTKEIYLIQFFPTTPNTITTKVTLLLHREHLLKVEELFWKQKSPQHQIFSRCHYM